MANGMPTAVLTRELPMLSASSSGDCILGSAMLLNDRIIPRVVARIPSDRLTTKRAAPKILTLADVLIRHFFLAERVPNPLRRVVFNFPQ